VRFQAGNLDYDFLLSHFKEGNLKLFFVNTTLSLDEEKLRKKVDKFYKLMAHNFYFRSLIEALNKSEQVKAIEINFLVLQAHE
jgi:hypothetical protein